MMDLSRNSNPSDRFVVPLVSLHKQSRPVRCRYRSSSEFELKESSA